MDKKSKILIYIILGLIIISVGATFYRYVIAKDYQIIAELPCDPATESCFVYECDPEAEECSEDPAENISYYKLISRNASNIPLCDPETDDTCRALVCEEGELDCEITLCNPDEEEECSVAEEPVSDTDTTDETATTTAE